MIVKRPKVQLPGHVAPISVPIIKPTEKKVNNLNNQQENSVNYFNYLLIF